MPLGIPDVKIGNVIKSRCHAEVVVILTNGIHFPFFRFCPPQGRREQFYNEKIMGKNCTEKNTAQKSF